MALEIRGQRAAFPKGVKGERPMNEAQLKDGYRLFVDLIEKFLDIKFKGFQSGFGIKPDLIQFEGPALYDPGNPLHGQRTTLTVPTEVMRMQQDRARQEVRDRWEKSYFEQAFHDRRHVEPQAESRAAL